MKRLIYIVIASVAFVGCKPEVIIPTPESGEIDASVFVAIGGDRVAGYQDDALSLNGQNNSLGAILNTQLQLVGGGDYLQPLISSADLGINTNDDAQLIMGYKTDCNGESSLSPVRYASSGATAAWSDNLYASNGPFHNMGVPGMGTADALLAGFSIANPFYNRFASGPTNSALTDAMASNGTFYCVDLGQDDILNYALSGGTSSPLIPESGAAGIGFDGSYDEIASNIAGANAKAVVCNIADITDFPYFTTIPYNGLTLDAANAESLNNLFNPLGLFFQEGDNPFTMSDPTAPNGVRKLVEGELILLSIPLDSVKCNGMGSIVPIPDQYVLTLDEIAEIESKTVAYNAIIQDISTTYNFALADFYSLFKSVNSGFTHNGVSYSGEFVSGGFFSLDGRNPTPKGMAFLANICIKAINNTYNAKIPLAEVSSYSGVLFP